MPIAPPRYHAQTLQRTSFKGIPSHFPHLDISVMHVRICR